MAKTKHRSYHVDRNSSFDEDEQIMRTKTYRQKTRQAKEVPLDDYEESDSAYFHMYEKFLANRH